MMNTKYYRAANDESPTRGTDMRDVKLQLTPHEWGDFCTGVQQTIDADAADGIIRPYARLLESATVPGHLLPLVCELVREELREAASFLQDITKGCSREDQDARLSRLSTMVKVGRQLGYIAA
jgi:hypothetical protein